MVDRESPSHEETLEVLRATLDPATYALATSALERHAIEQKEQAERDKDFDRIVAMVEMTDQLMQRAESGLVADSAGLIMVGVDYLRSKQGKSVETDLDRAARLYAAYCLAADSYVLGEDGNTLQLIDDSLVPRDELLTLLNDYLHTQTGSYSATYTDLEVVFKGELLSDEYVVDYFPHPGLVDGMRDELVALGFDVKEKE